MNLILNMLSISVKELRENLPMVRRQLKKGASFLVIYQSKPLAKLTPVNEEISFEEAKDEDVEMAALSDWDDEALSPEELDYYLSLK